jgi:hypothetical protein
MTVRARVACAALISMALHGLVISGSWIPLPESPAKPQPLLARLVPAPEPQPPLAKPRTPRPAKPAAAPASPVAALPGPASPPAPVPALVPEPVPDVRPDIPHVDIPPETPPVPEPQQQLARAAESSAAIPRSLPRRGRITYSVLYGDSRALVGKVVQSWEVENDVYRLASEAETAGIIDVFRPQRLHYLSRGKVTREGLRPESFLMSRTRRGRTEAAQARFDWDSGTLDYGLARDPKSAPLPAGAHDFMSFIFQHVLLPPAPGRYRVPITTGSRFEVFEVEVAVEEVIETPIGTLRALPVRQMPRPGSESVHIWLAAEYHYLPVRVRHYDRQGSYSGEQVVNEIRISDE